MRITIQPTRCTALLSADSRQRILSWPVVALGSGRPCSGSSRDASLQQAQQQAQLSHRTGLGRRPEPWGLRSVGGKASCAASPAEAVAAAGALARTEPQYEVRPVSGDAELQEVAMLRAEAFYEDDASRFVGSLKKKFAGQEVESLRVRTRQGRGPSGTPPCECLVALQPGGSGGVLGCIDLRLPASAASVHPEGVPPGDASGAYLLNVVVAADQRRRGIGRWLMLEGMARAVQVWKAQRLYTHVEADNEAAYQLYAACGFCEQAEEEAAVEGATRLGRLILLVAHASAVRPQAVS